ncbi:MAG: hypothetical protein HC778_01215 [Chamaesiphon sp. CSU_1_12]|nr:hypothetical protein [Chamaesiphon sp. CSU_1_12]
MLVCRDGMDGASSNVRTKGKAKKKTSPPAKIQLVARIKKSGSIGKNLNSTEEIKEKLGKYFRVEHIRKLPYGWKPSSKQIELAKDYGFTLPENYTFVSPSEGEQDNIKKISIHLINQPIFKCKKCKSN